MTAFETRMRRRARLAAFAKIVFVLFALSSMVMGGARACRSVERSRNDVGFFDGEIKWASAQS